MSKEIHREEVIHSHAHPFQGQSHRSSGNFSTRYIHDEKGRTPKSLIWKIIPRDGDDASQISFQVYEDVPLGIDRKKFKGKKIRHGDKTAFINEREVYIYLPEGANSSFDVSIVGSSDKPTVEMLEEASEDFALASDPIDEINEE